MEIKSFAAISLLSLLTSACSTLPGNSRADWLLASDTKRLVFMASMTKAQKDCRSYKLIDTQATDSPTQQPGQMPSWHETWTVDACGTKVAVPVKFTKGRNGGTDMLIDSKGIKVVQ